MSNSPEFNGIATQASDEPMRAAFEAAMIERGHPIRLHTDGTYLGMNSYRWEGWQAGVAVKAQAVSTESQSESPFKFRPWSKEAEMIEGWTAAEKACEAAQGALPTNPNLTTSSATYQPSGNTGELAKDLDNRDNFDPALANSSNNSSSSNSPEIEGIARHDFDQWFEREYPRDGDRRPKYQQSGVMDLMRAAWTASRSEPANAGTAAQGEDGALLEANLSDASTMKEN